MKLGKRITSSILTIATLLSILPSAVSAVGTANINKVAEFETASKKQGILDIKSESASGGEYCIYEGPEISDTSKTTEEDFSWIYNFEKSSRADVYVRAYFDSLSKISFYYCWDNEPWQSFDAEVTDDFKWFKIGTDNLSEGKHKLRILHKNSGGLFDCVYVTESGGEAPEISGVKPMPIRESVKTEKNIVQIQKNIPLVTGEGIVIEAETASLESGMSISTEKNASGKVVVAANTNPDRITPTAGDTAAFEMKFSADKDGKYFIWVRMLFPNDGSDSFYCAVNEEKYTTKAPAASPDFQWFKLMSVEMKASETVTFRMEPREFNWKFDQIVVTTNQLYMPQGIVNEVKQMETVMEQTVSLPPVNPPANEHPRVYFREGDINSLIQKLEHSDNAAMKEQFLNMAKARTVTVGDIETIQAKAYYYALYKDEKIGRQAVEAANDLVECEYTILDNTRYYGRILYTLGMVYDWCFDLMTDEERKHFVDIAASKGSQMEIGWPPVQQGAIADHGAEAQLLRDYLAFAIAVADQRPDIWNLVGGLFYQEYVPVRKFVHPAGLPHQGSNYGIYRHVYDVYAYLLIMGMGCEEPYDGEAMTTAGYGWELYLRRPDGSKMYDGDVYQYDQMKATHQPDVSVLQAMVSRDPYLNDQALREIISSDKNGIKYAISEMSLVDWLILFDPTVGRKSIYDLPLSRYFGSPMGVMAARTGWNDGVDSPDVVAMMKLGEYNFDNHHHKDAGNFILWYKGPLATESGIYQDGASYGTEPHMSYTKQSIAHNTMLVYDPEEDSANFYNGVNDGGQRGVGGYRFFNDFINSDTKTAEILAHEIDSSNGKQPAYTYLKGDLTNAYSDKVKEFKRSFMFLNLFDDEVPAALIVFDKVTSSKPEFKKSWLLHGQTYPQINNGRSTWFSSGYTNDSGYTYQGKMIVDTLLPSVDNLQTNVVGGPQEGWCVINGIDYNHPQKLETREENAYRLEVSPKKASNTDYFLNVLQVSDADKDYYRDVKIIDTNDFYGVQVSDRAALFSKSGERIEDGFKISLNGGEGTYKFTVCDIKSGVWTIKCGEKTVEVSVSEDGGVLAFEAPFGDIEARRIGDLTSVESKMQETEEETAADTIYVKYKNNFAYMPASPVIKNEKLMVPISDLVKQMGLEADMKFISMELYDSKQELKATLKLNSDEMITNNAVVKFTNPVYSENGEWFVELRPFAEYFNHKIFWSDKAKTVYMYPDKKEVVRTAEGYIEIVSAKNDDGPIDGENIAPNVIDGNLGTIWANEGEGRYIDFELKQEEVIENIEIIFNPNSKRTPYFMVQISEDGTNYHTVYDGVGSSEADGKNWEVFTFDIRKNIKAKYVRYVANKSNLSAWNGVKEIRFKRGKELVIWEKAENEAEVKEITPDKGDIDGENVASNIMDLMNRTMWRSEGKGRYVQFELAQKSTLSGVDIVFEPIEKRRAKFEIMVSDDGVNFKTVYSGVSDANSGENQWQSFKFDTPAEAKYVRYVGKGSNISIWNGVREIRFIQ